MFPPGPTASASLNELAQQYARGPSQTTIDRAVSIHENVRDALGDRDYLTFLQGSYKNSTSLWDMNDVDIVAVARSTFSTSFTGKRGANSVTWDEIFRRIEAKLDERAAYRGKWTREDKCIRLNTGVKIDIVPAIYVDAPETDPIAIYSRKNGKERKNWPRDHYSNGAQKSERTSGGYKQLVRLAKAWRSAWFRDSSVAPSYYLECLVYSMPDSLFGGNLATNFLSFAQRTSTIEYGWSTLPRIAGEGNLLASDEWDETRFRRFVEQLALTLPRLRRAIANPSAVRAEEDWVAAFNGQRPR